MKNKRNLRAFSLIEISIVVLIIGILIAGVTQSSRLVAQAKVSTAKALTQSAPVSSIKGASLWIESVSEGSFQTADIDDGALVTTWKDINPQTGTKSDLSGGTSPTYNTNIIGGLPAVKFNGSSTFLTTSNFLNITTGYSSVFAVVKLPVTLAAQTIFDKSSAGSTPNIRLNTHATAANGWSYLDSAGTYSANGGAVVAGAGNYVVSMVYNANLATSGNNTTTGIAIFQNGAAKGKVSTTSTPNASASSGFMLGKDAGNTSFFGGYVGEVIIFDRALKKEERQSVESYLGKKWSITMTTESY